MTTKSPQQTLREALIAARKAKSMPQSEVGDRLGLSQVQISRLETVSDERLKLAPMLRLARVLGYDLEVLLVPLAEDERSENEQLQAEVKALSAQETTLMLQQFSILRRLREMEGQDREMLLAVLESSLRVAEDLATSLEERAARDQ